MRQLTTTLLETQKQPAALPYLKIEAAAKDMGVIRLAWDRLYSGTEADYYHALTVPDDGSLVRVRITPPSDARKLYRQRVAVPGPGSDFSPWTYTGQYNAVVVAAASREAEVSIFWINTSRELRRIKSTDYGVTWGSPELIDYSPTTSINGLAVAYKTSGDLAVFFADQATLYVKKYVAGSWQAKIAWDKSTGDLSGVACIYDTDWCLMVTGRDSAGNYRLWTLAYGDGGEVPAGNWSVLCELAAAPSGGDFTFYRPFLDKTDVYRCFFVEKFTGTEAYSRPFRSAAVPGTAFSDGLWREPAPFSLASEYGLALAYDTAYAWLSSPSGVWRAPLAASVLELTDDVTAARQETGENMGNLSVELANDDGKYAVPGQGDIAALDIGCQLDFSPGYITASGPEYSPGLSFRLESCEHVSAGGKTSLVLRAVDGWGTLAAWKARYQIRWNRTSSETCVRDILRFILGRVGLRLEVISQSSVVTGFFPDFTVGPGDTGREAVIRLLSYVPDVIFIEGNLAYLVNPLAADDAVHDYGTSHPIFEGSYQRAAMTVNRVQVAGFDTVLVLADSFAWAEIDRLDDRLRQIDDRNITTTAQALDLGQARLRQSEMASESGNIIVPVNCGQQLYDVITVTDGRAGLDGVKKRVLGLVLAYSPRRGEYRQRLSLGRV
jgi:hypothetical protein